MHTRTPINTDPLRSAGNVPPEHTCTHANTHAHRHTHTQIHTKTRDCAQSHCIYNLLPFTYTLTHTYTHTHTHTQTYTETQTHAQLYMHTHTNIHRNTNARTIIYVYVKLQVICTYKHVRVQNAYVHIIPTHKLKQTCVCRCYLCV